MKSSHRFDILVNGGTMVTLHLQRIPFHPVKRTVFVPSNQIVVLHSPIVMNVQHESVEEPLSLVSVPYSAPLYQAQAPIKPAHHHPQHDSLSVESKSESDVFNQPDLYSALFQYTHHSSLGTSHRHFLKQQSSVTDRSQFGTLHCWSHDYHRLRVRIVRSNLLASQQIYSLPKSAVLMDSGSLQEVFSLPASRLNLVYQSFSR